RSAHPGREPRVRQPQPDSAPGLMRIAGRARGLGCGSAPQSHDGRLCRRRARPGMLPIPTAAGARRGRPTADRVDRRGMTLDAAAQEAEMIAIDTMRANVIQAPEKFNVVEVERPRPGPGEALISVTLTTICGTDVHIVKGEYRVRPGLVLGHEPVGVIEELGSGITGYEVGDRVLVGAIQPCRQSDAR